jgi:hypothetical protein
VVCAGRTAGYWEAGGCCVEMVFDHPVASAWFVCCCMCYVLVLCLSVGDTMLLLVHCRGELVHG